MNKYYQILGLQPGASKDDIKKAFKKLAKQYHPDVVSGSAEKFKEISEAYEGLMSGQAEPASQRRNTKPDDFFSDLLRRKFSREYDSPWGGGVGGGWPDRSWAHFVHGYDGSHVKIKPEFNIIISLKDALKGGTFTVALPENNEKIPVYIAPKTTTGTKINVVSKNMGDITVCVEISQTHGFILKGDDLETSVSISLQIAILGGEVKVKTPCEDFLLVTIPPGTNNGATLSLRGQGLGNNGSLLVKINVILPKKLSPEAAEAFKVFCGLLE